MTLKDQIKEKIQNTLVSLFDVHDDSVIVSYPETQFGDYATPVAMGLAKKLKKNPREIATQIAESLGKDPLFESVEIAGPGFINFRLTSEAMDAALLSAAGDKGWGTNATRKDEKILLEYVSANPTGPLHIGHGRWAAIGDTMARVLTNAGADVDTEFYVNDAGNQIKMLNASVAAVKAGGEVPENGYHGDYIHDIAKVLKDGEEAKDILLDMQKKTLADFGVEFDRYFSELSLHNGGKVEEAIADLKTRGVTYEEDGALWFRTTDYGDDKDRVLIKADGNYTYFAVDIAYHREKVLRGYNELVNVFGADHHGYVARLNAAVEVFGNQKTKLNIIIGQLVSLFRDGEPVRMSKRTGDMITLEEVIEEIGRDAARYYLVMRKTDSAMDFDLALAKKQSDDNPVFYIQYAFARLSGVLRNAAEQNEVVNSKATALVDSEEARELALWIIRFPELLGDIARTLEPHRVPELLTNLAQAFHRFYHHHRVLGEGSDIAGRRLVLVHAVQNALAHGLDLIGVSAPERM